MKKKNKSPLLIYAIFKSIIVPQENGKQNNKNKSILYIYTQRIYMAMGSLTFFQQAGSNEQILKCLIWIIILETFPNKKY